MTSPSRSFTLIAAATTIAVALAATASPALAGGKGLAVPPSDLAQSLDVWTEGLKSDLPRGPLSGPAHDTLQDRVVGMKIGYEGDVTVVGKALVREPADPHAEAAGALSITVRAKRHPAGSRRVALAVEGSASLDPQTQTVAQNYSGTLSWIVHDDPVIASKLRVSSNVSIDSATMSATPSLGPEWVTTKRLSEIGARVRSDLTARMNYTITPDEPLNFTAKLELRMSPR